MKELNSNGGYIALISTIIISALLLTIVVALNLSGFLGRFNILDSESKEVSIGLAEACVANATLQLARGIIPAANTIVAVGTNQCTLISVTGSGIFIITTQAIYNRAYTNLVVSFTPATNTINSWQEVP